MGMKCLEARKVPFTRNAKMRWRDQLVKFRHRIVFDANTISELRNGLEVGKQLELPSDFSCNHQHLADLLASDTFVRPFGHLMYVDSHTPLP